MSNEITDLRDRLQHEWEGGSRTSPGMRRVSFNIFMLFKIRALEAGLETAITFNGIITKDAELRNRAEIIERLLAKLEAMEQENSNLRERLARYGVIFRPSDGRSA